MRHIQINGRTIAEVADILCKAYNTIKAWYGRFARRGPAGPGDALRPGRPPKIKNQTPDGFLKRGRPTFPSVLAEEIRDATGVEYTASACRWMLRKAGWSPKVPMPVHFRRAPVEVRKWQAGMKRWYSCLVRDGFTFYVMDQVNVLLDYVRRRGPWTRVGERAYLTYHGAHSMAVVCGAISSRGSPVFSITDRFRTDEAVEFLGDLVRRRKVGLVMDRPPVHTSRAVRDFIEDNRRRLRVTVPHGLTRAERGRAPVERHEVAAVRPPAVRVGGRQDRRAQGLPQQLQGQHGHGKNPLCKTDCKDFLTPLYTPANSYAASPSETTGTCRIHSKCSSRTGALWRKAPQTPRIGV